MQLSSIVNVTITALTKQLTQLGFGTPLIARYHTLPIALVKEFFTIGEMVDAGLDEQDPAVQMATAIWSQNPRPLSIKVGKRALPFTQTIEVTPINTTVGFIYAFTVDSIDISVTVPASPDNTVAKICDALVTALAAVTTVTATDETTKVTIETKVAGDLVDYEGFGALSPDDCLFEDVTEDPGIDDDLSAWEIADPSGWYGLLLDSNSSEEIQTAADWIKARTKLLAYNNSDSACVDSGSTTDVAAVLMAAAYTRTFGIYSQKKLLSWMAAAWMGKCFAMDPGTETWCYKNLEGVSWDNKLTGGQESNLLAKRMSIYTSLRDQNFTFGAKTASGEWIDVVRFIDWLTARMQERCFAPLLNLRKLPFTDSGIDSVVSQVSAQLQEGVKVGGLAADPKPTCTAPKAKDVSDANKALRKLPDINFEAHLAGAIHLLVINGVVSL